MKILMIHLPKQHLLCRSSIYKILVDPQIPLVTKPSLNPLGRNYPTLLCFPKAHCVPISMLHLYSSSMVTEFLSVADRDPVLFVSELHEVTSSEPCKQHCRFYFKKQ